MSGTPALRFNRPSGFHWPRLVVALACAAVLNGPLITESNAAGAKVHDPDRGTLTFSAETAVVSGAGVKRETAGAGDVLSGWTDPADRARWEVKPTRWGRYDVELVGASTGSAGASLSVALPGTNFVVQVAGGGADTFARIPLGRFYLAKSDPFTVEVRRTDAGASGGLRLRSVTLKPAPEGDPIFQGADGVIVLPSAGSTTRSITMRFEPATNKNCCGYWVDPADWAEWTFEVLRPGTYDIEVWQGCGGGQGGSEAVVEAAGNSYPFIVEETGHFQNFVPRRVGRVTYATPGPYTLSIKPQSKKAAAVMDIRRIRLVPANTASLPAPAARDWVAARRIVVLGDSITYGGEWVEWVETWLHLAFPDAQIEVLNLGLPSETASGLSEAGHAGGAFPRPDVHERLGRVLEKLRPDLIVACYGMNDGIYFPLGEERFRKFREGMTRLHDRAAHEGVRVVHLTPPVFDPVPLAGKTLPAGLDAYPSPYTGYNEVLDRYSEWLLSRRVAGWEVVDVHGPMNRFLSEHRAQDPKFLLAGDGVHANAQGHWLMAREVLRHLGAPEAIVSAETSDALLKSDPRAPAVLAAVQRRQRALKDPWLTAVGHQRPGMGAGRPLPEAQREAAEAAQQLQVKP